MVLEEVVKRVASYDIDGDRAVRVHSVNVRGFASLPSRSRCAEHAPVHLTPRRAAVVTGASSGIGRASPRLGAAGCPVVLGACRVDRCEAAAAEIRAAGGEAIALPLDLVDDASVRVRGAGRRLLGLIDIVVSNAGEVRPATAVDADPAVLSPSSRSTCSDRSAWCTTSCRPWSSGATATWCS